MTEKYLAERNDIQGEGGRRPSTRKSDLLVINPFPFEYLYFLIAVDTTHEFGVFLLQRRFNYVFKRILESPSPLPQGSRVMWTNIAHGIDYQSPS